MEAAAMVGSFLGTYGSAIASAATTIYGMVNKPDMPDMPDMKPLVAGGGVDKTGQIKNREIELSKRRKGAGSLIGTSPLGLGRATVAKKSLLGL